MAVAVDAFATHAKNMVSKKKMVGFIVVNATETRFMRPVAKKTCR